MSELADIESAVIGLIESIQIGGSDLFATVAGFSNSSSREVVAALRREIKPAAYVVYGDRESSDAFGVPGKPDFSVFAIAESLRGGSEPRSGSILLAGGFNLLAELFNALFDQTILADRRLSFLDERLVAADETSVVYQQRYSVLRTAATAAPTFGGVVICGADSIVVVEVGEWATDDQRFAFPGIDGEFRMLLGARARPIVWKGQLRADTDADLSAIEAGIEQLIAGGLADVMADGHGRTFDNCAASRLVRRGGRRKHSISGEILQDFDLHFVQLV